MALDPTLVGRSYPPSAVYEVGRQKITEFAEAIGAADPVHRDAAAARAAGHPDVTAPPPRAVSGVGRQESTEVAEASGAADPVHRDAEAARAAGHPDVIAPPTFVIA